MYPTKKECDDRLSIVNNNLVLLLDQRKHLNNRIGYLEQEKKALKELIVISSGCHTSFLAGDSSSPVFFKMQNGKVFSDNKIRGIVIGIDYSTTSILLQTPDVVGGTWWHGIGKKVQKQFEEYFNSEEVELTILNQENHTFSYLNVLKDENVSGDVFQKLQDSEGDGSAISPRPAYYRRKQ